MLSKKYYEMFSKIFANKLPYDGSQQLWIELLEDLSNELEKDNPRFNRQKFLDACGRMGRAKNE